MSPWVNGSGETLHCLCVPLVGEAAYPGSIFFLTRFRLT